MKLLKSFIIIYCSLLILLLSNANNVFSQAQVVPCQLNNPDQDTARLFPDRTNYRIEFIRTDEVGDKRGVGGEGLYRELEKRLNDKWDPIWETKDIPYVFYEILKGPDRIGWIFGANQGWPGADNSQLMLAFDLDGRIQEFYYQKLPSIEKKAFQSSQYYSQFIGLTLEHFYFNEYLTSLNKKDITLDMIARINNPAAKEQEGFQKTLRGIKKILIYLDDFKLNNRFNKEESLTKFKTVIENQKDIPLLEEKDLIEIYLKNYPSASRYITDIISIKDKHDIINERLGLSSNKDITDNNLLYPVYVIYKEDIYKDPFVRGIVLGYVIAFNIDDKNKAVLIVGAQDKEKGKIGYLQINNTKLPQFKGISLVNYYTKDVLTKTNTIDNKIDKIAPIKNINIDDNDITGDTLKEVKKALIIIDEFYLHNFYKKDDIMKKIEDYLKTQKNK